MRSTGASIHAGGTPPAAGTADLLKRLARNAPLFVQHPGESEGSRHPGILVGNVRNQRLLIAVYDGLELDVGQPVTVRLNMGAHLVGFETRVIAKLDHPPLYAVEFPARLEAVNLRKSHRIQAFFPADVKMQVPGTDQLMLLKTRVLDISTGGCSFRSKTKLPASAVHIAFALPGERHILSLQGAIVESTRAGLVHHSRVKFTQDAANAPAMQEVAKWVSECVTFGMH
jgi:hypothetical protein